MSERRSDCPISFALDILGDRWTLLVVRDLIFTHKRNFQDFADSPERIASNILSDRLGRLERAGVIARRRDPTNARRVDYWLTSKGLDLIPILLELIRWGGTHDPQTAAPRWILQRIEHDREAFASELRAAALARAPAPVISAEQPRLGEDPPPKRAGKRSPRARSAR